MGCTGAKAWCLGIHAEACLSPSLSGCQAPVLALNLSMNEGQKRVCVMPWRALSPPRVPAEGVRGGQRGDEAGLEVDERGVFGVSEGGERGLRGMSEGGQRGVRGGSEGVQRGFRRGSAHPLPRGDAATARQLLHLAAPLPAHPRRRSPGPARYEASRHPTHVEPLFVELNSIL